jgi:hypothetical protein
MRDFDEQVWKLVTELGQEERHFNQVQHQYRLLASTWLLAMFAGVGFALSKQNLNIPAELIVSVVGLSGGIGITQLWNLDIRVYHQLLDSCFVQGLKLEQEYPWLPQLRSSMLSTQSQGPSASATEAAQKRSPPSSQGVLARVVWFYIVSNTVALLIAMVGIAVFLYQLQLSTAPMITLGLILVGAILIAVWDYELYRHTRSPLIEEWANQALQPTPQERRG